MIATKSPFRTLPKVSAKKIPSVLIYEVMDGSPIYYKGYREVMAGNKTIDEVRGINGLRAIIIEYLLINLFTNLNRKLYRILTNEIGLHINHRNNLSGDIVIYEKAILPVKSADKHYISIPPKIQIEVDLDASTENFESPDNYIYAKTNKLLEFGTEKVIWVLSATKKVLVATPNADWQVIAWNKDIEIIDNITFNVGKYLLEEGSLFA